MTDNEQAKLLGVSPFDLTSERADGGRVFSDKRIEEAKKRRAGELMEELVRLVEETAN